MKFYGRMLLAAICAAALLLAGCLPERAEPEGSDTAIGVSQVRQLAAADNTAGRTLMWTGSRDSEYAVEVRREGEWGTRSFKAENVSFKDGKYEYIQYKAALSGLEPGTDYRYRVVRGGACGRWHSLRTDGGGAFKALIFPDSQSSNYSGWTELARGAWERNKDAALYVNMGDLVDNGQDYYQWQQWLGSVEPFSGDIPLAPVIGNHETYSLEWQIRMPDAYTGLFSLPGNGMEKYRNQFYSFDYGPVHFTVIDTNFDDELIPFEPQLAEDQKRWLEQDLASAAAKWKVVLQHRDIVLYGFGPKSGRPQTGTYFIETGLQLMPIYEKYDVDAVLSAHLHTYRRRVPLRGFAPAEDGITYILTGVAGSVRYPNLWGEWEWDAARAPQPETANYMTMEADGEKLVFKAFLPDGRQFDETVIRKRV